MTGDEAPAVRPVRWWHRLHAWTPWEYRHDEGADYKVEWLERHCVRCGLIKRRRGI